MNAAVPRIWVLLGRRLGDNNQALELAETLGWPFEVKTLRYNLLRRLPPRLPNRGFFALDRASRATLAPPWPDLVIAIGRRSTRIALEIRARSRESARLVQLGEPRRPPAWFDLVLTTPQYRVPPAPNVVPLPLALTRGIRRHAIGEAAVPLTVMLVGGESWPWRLDERRLVEAARLARARATGAGGRVVALTSQRADPRVRAMLAAILGPDAIDPMDYRAAVAAGTEFLVTADSVSMLSDAIVTGRPVGMIPVRPVPSGRLWVPAWRRLRGPAPLYPRDLPRFWRAIKAAGLVGTVEHPVAGDAPDAAGQARAAVLRLLGPRFAPPPASA